MVSEEVPPFLQEFFKLPSDSTLLTPSLAKLAVAAFALGLLMSVLYRRFTEAFLHKERDLMLHKIHVSMEALQAELAAKDRRIEELNTAVTTLLSTKSELLKDPKAAVSFEHMTVLIQKPGVLPATHPEGGNK